MKKTRNTRQRSVILEILRSTRSHPSAEAIYREARVMLPHISLGTVYRNLGFLRDQGLVRELGILDASGSRYEATIAPHAHFRCLLCNAIHDIPLPATIDDLGGVRSEVISSILEFELHVSGHCTGCIPAPSQPRGT